MSPDHIIKAIDTLILSAAQLANMWLTFVCWKVVPGIPNTDLLHASASLYGVSLAEVTDDIIYPTLCEKWSKSILMILDESDAIERVKQRFMTAPKQAEEGSKVKLRNQTIKTLHEKQEQSKWVCCFRLYPIWKVLCLKNLSIQRLLPA